MFSTFELCLIIFLAISFGVPEKSFLSIYLSLVFILWAENKIEQQIDWSLIDSLCEESSLQQWCTKEFFFMGGIPEIFFGGRVQQIQLRTEGREK
jgi:hypothetical protein